MKVGIISVKKSGNQETRKQKCRIFSWFPGFLIHFYCLDARNGSVAAILADGGISLLESPPPAIFSAGEKPGSRLGSYQIAKLT